MATELGQAYVQIMPSAKGIGGSISKTLDPESTSAGKSAGSKIAGTIKGVIAVAAIGKAISASISAGADLQQSLGGIETLFKDNADKVKKHASEAYKTTGLSANAYMENVTSFSASLLQSLGGDTDKAAEKSNMAMIDMADNSNKMGTSMEMIQNAYQGFAKQNYTMLDNLKLGYGGTKSEMERLLTDATKLTGVKYDTNNLSDVYDAIHVVQEELDITGTTAKESSETFGGSLSSMKGAFSNFLGNLSLGKDVGPSLNALAETTSTFLFGNLLPMLGNIIKALPGALVAFVKEFAPRLMEEGGNLVTNLVNGFTTSMPKFITGLETMFTNVKTYITENLPAFLDKGSEIVTNLVNGITSSLPAFMTGIESMRTNVMNYITDNLPMFLEKGIEIVTNLVNGIMQAAPQLVESAWTSITNFTTFIMDNLPVILEAGKNLLLSLVDGIVASLPAIVEGAIRGLNSFLATIKEKLPGVLQSGKETILSLVDGIIKNLPAIVESAMKALSGFLGALAKNLPSIIKTGIEFIVSLVFGLIKAIPKLIAAMPEIIASIVKGLGSGLGSMVTIGLDLIKGLWNGIKDAQKWLMDKISGFVDGIVGGIKDFFGIHSPSKLFRDEIGAMLPRGLAVGIEANTQPVTNAMNELSNLTMGSFDSVMPALAVGKADYSVSKQSTSSNGDILESSGSGNSTTPIYMELDGKVFAQLIGDYTGVDGGMRIRRLQRGLAL